jgi:flagellar basal-body rod protein FlgG
VLEGMYTAAAGMAAQQQRLSALSNDLANVNTTGYKRTRIAFRDLVYTPAGPGTSPGVTEGAGAAAQSVGRGSAQGALKRTDRRLDVALAGPGFIRARGNDGSEVLTRDGSLHLDQNGRMLTSSGHFTGVTLPPGTSEDKVEISRDGSVTVGTRNVGRLDLVVVRANDGLRPNGDNTFSATVASGAATTAQVKIEQGALEASNVDVADAMTDMIEAQRSFELASRAIRMQDQLLEIANGVKR